MSVFIATDQKVLTGAAVMSWALRAVPLSDKSGSTALANLLTDISERKPVVISPSQYAILYNLMPAESIHGGNDDGTYSKFAAFIALKYAGYPQYQHLIESASSPSNLNDIADDVQALKMALFQWHTSGGSATGSTSQAIQKKVNREFHHLFGGGAVTNNSAVAGGSVMKSVLLGAAAATLVKYALKRNTETAVEFGAVAGISSFVTKYL